MCHYLFVLQKLPLSAEELIQRTPIISADGGVMLGSKNTTVFLVDAKSGTVIYAFRSDDHSAIKVQSAKERKILPRKDVGEWMHSGNLDTEEVEQPLYVVRTDYAFKYYSRKTGKDLWHLKFAEIEASFQCQEAGDFLREVSSIPPEGEDEFPLNCKKRAVVYRIRDHSLLHPLFVSDRLPSTNLGGGVPSLPASGPNHLSIHHPSLPAMHYSKEGRVVLALPPQEAEDFGALTLYKGDGGKMYTNISPEILSGSHMWYFVVFSVLGSLIVAFLLHITALVFRQKRKLNKQSEEGKVQNVIPKKKKSRKSGTGKNIATIESNLRNVSHENTVRDTNERLIDNQVIERTGRNLQLAFLDPVDGVIDRRKIGKLFISNKVIARGSNGTIVLEGVYDGRSVAVKRLVRSHHDVALKEIQNLIASDCHPNIVRWYGVEYDENFVYLSLERCTCSLYDLIFSYMSTSHNQVTDKDQDPSFPNECLGQLPSAIQKDKDFELWKANGFPSAQLLKLMRDIVSGLAHLHELGIIHRDLKPQNVLIIKDRSMRAKLSDMGISKRLPGDMSFLTQNSTGCGSSGWQAPEQLRHGRQTRAVDLFSLGCVLFFCLTGGQHPFGDSFERDANIVNNRKDLFLLENIPEAMDLISRLLDPNPDLRPKAKGVFQHPLFWNAEMRLSFLRDASDRVELEDREGESELLKALENIAPVALNGKWDEKMDSAFINDIGRYRRYKFDSVRDLLRVVRNKLNHYRELSQEIQGILGQVPEGFDSYFSSRFPLLLIEVYKVIYRYCGEEEFLSKYFRSSRSQI
ncbi:serine/threonine-protein kinase/endoribonuclease IRE1b-like isoform X2 [Diospyros lotus]|uniref:serine/threonine-protein kinase/endoribonuclease IRE1b-like isoform X2 n=1 Tax=Diospyros lotus TaxID=55363 RepID=UPI00225B7BD7|nr:serine/threonine-protein kinase/endoribonuclease IRE1b-like isoform X2 [Diospyros lotus]